MFQYKCTFYSLFVDVNRFYRPKAEQSSLQDWAIVKKIDRKEVIFL